MSAKECVVCAWRAACSLKFRYESSELHCREYTRDVSPGLKETKNENKKEDTG